MPTTRSQTHLSQQGPLRGRGQGDHRPNRAPSSLALPIPEYARIHYDTQHLSPVSAERAAKGSEASFIYHSLKSKTDDEDKYLAFQLYVPVAVRVYDSVSQREQQDRVTCTCVHYQSSQSACVHLYASQYLDSAVRALICTVAFHTLKSYVERQSTREPASLDADRNHFRI